MGVGGDFPALLQTLEVLRKLIGVSVLVQLVEEGVHRLRDLALLLECMKGRFDKTGIVRVRRRVLADQHERNSDQKNVDNFEVLPNREPELPLHKSPVPVCSAGIVPLNAFWTRDRNLTRPFASVVTPCHAESAPLLNQLVLLVQFAPSVAL